MIYFAVGLSLLTGNKLIEESEHGFILSIVLVERAKKRFKNVPSLIAEKL